MVNLHKETQEVTLINAILLYVVLSAPDVVVLSNKWKSSQQMWRVNNIILETSEMTNDIQYCTRLILL